MMHTAWDNTLQFKTRLMEVPDFPIALGVIRDVDAPTYNDAVEAQIEEVKSKRNTIISRSF